MFARTSRLTLRPAWPEDAGAMAAAIAHESVARMLPRVPWPYTPADAEAFCGQPRTGTEPRLVILSHDGDYPRLVGGIGLQRDGATAQLGYWLTPSAWGRGYATEAARAVVDIAHRALGLARLDAWHFVDNPASARVLAKLGFRPTGRTAAKSSAARRAPASSAEMALDLAEADRGEMPMAA